MQLKSQIFSWRFRRGLSVAITILSFSPPEVPSIAPQPQALHLDLGRVNKRNQKVLSRAIHVEISSLSKIGGVVCEMSVKEHEGPSSLLLKVPHIYMTPKLSLFPLYYYYMLHCCCTILYTSCFAGGWMVYWCYCCTAIS